MAVCPAIKGHLILDGWLQDKSEVLDEEGENRKKVEELKLIEMRRRAGDEEEKLKRMREEMAEAVAHQRSMKEARETLMTERDALLDKVESLKAQTYYGCWEGDHKEQDEEPEEGPAFGSACQRGGSKEYESEAEEESRRGWTAREDGPGWEKREKRRKGKKHRTYWKKLEKGGRKQQLNKK